MLLTVRFELTPFQTGALNQRLRPLGHVNPRLSIEAQFQALYHV